MRLPGYTLLGKCGRDILTLEFYFLLHVGYFLFKIVFKNVRYKSVYLKRKLM